MRQQAMIFLTGAGVLSLEVLASRIMTPYFGVSLFIWAGILSITLTFLAVGYYAGSAISSRVPRGVLEFAYLAAPVVAAVAIVVAAVIYPLVFPHLAGTNLVVASFVGGALLLALPLVALSAMNPFLVALQRVEGDVGDAGAGRVFFISTIGSVAGVLVTAFVFIPLMRNLTGILVIAVGLCGLVALFALAARTITARQRGALLGLALATSVAAIALIVGQHRYLSTVGGDAGFDFSIEAEYTSMYGNIKVVKISSRQVGAQPLLAFLQDGLVQNRALEDGSSLSLYTYFLETLAATYKPEASSVLALGLGAGIVPRNLARRGIDVTAVEINQDSLVAAEMFFRFDPSEVDVRIEDARTFVRRCNHGDHRYDLAVVDLFHGDNTPDYLMTREFFADLSACLSDSGVVVMNAFFDQEDDRPNGRIRATIRSAFVELYEYRSPNGAAFLAASKRPLGPPARLEPVRVPIFVREQFGQAAANVRRVSAADVSGFEPITDQHNVFKVLFSEADRRLRRNLAEGLPVQFLVN